MKRFADSYPRISAWLVFFTGVAVLLLIDHLLRVSDGQVQDGGLPEVIYYGVPVLVGIVSVWFLWRAVRTYRRRVLGFAEIAAHVGVGAVVYLFTLFFYVVGTGIDSL